MVAGGSRRHWSEDDALADEIELYGELVVAASESEQELSLPQIDKVLGLEQDGPEPGGSTTEPSDDDTTGARSAQQVDVRDSATRQEDAQLPAGWA